MSYLPVAKLAVQLTANVGISKILSDIVKNNVVIATTLEKVTVSVGTFVLGSMLVQQSFNHIDNFGNDIVAWHEERKAETQK